MAGNNLKIGGGGFHHVAMRVKNFDAVVKFYKEALGFREKITWGEGDKRAVMLDTGDGNYLEIFAGGTEGEKPEGTVLHIAFRSNDCAAAIECARAAGAEVTIEPKELEIKGSFTAPVKLAFCKGLGGEIIEFFESKGDL